MIGLLIFLGLLGTFWGLLQTIGTVGQVINGLSVTGEDFATLFTRLKHGLATPLAGMGTAFSSSLFGLGGSLILGFVDIQTGHAQNRFFNEMEEWLSGVTRLVDTDDAESKEGGQPTNSVQMDEINTHLKILISQVGQNNKLMHEHLRYRLAKKTGTGPKQ